MMQLNSDQQTCLLSSILSSYDLYVRAKPVLRPEFFAPELQGAVKYVEDFSNTYNCLPPFEQINADNGTRFVKFADYANNAELQQAALDGVNKYCRVQAMGKALAEGAKRLANGDTDTIMSLVEEAQRIGVRRDFGINFWEDQTTWMKKTAEMTGSVKSGWNILDENIGGGFNWGELEIIVSPSGGGKSLAMANLGLSFSLRGYNVIYFTLELARELVGKRIFSMQTGIPQRELKGNIDNALNAAGKMRQGIKGDIGQFRLVDLPQRSTVTDIDSRVRELEGQLGCQFQIIIIDYADLMAPRDRRIDPTNVSVTGRYIVEELRGWCKDTRTNGGLPTLCITASQVGKDSMTEMDLNMSNLSGSVWKINTADLIFSVRTNKVMRENGKYEFKILKNRNGGGLDNTFKVEYDPTTLLIGNIGEMTDNKITPEAYAYNKDNYKTIGRKVSLEQDMTIPPVQSAMSVLTPVPTHVPIQGQMPPSIYGNQPAVMIKKTLDAQGNETQALINKLINSS